MIFIFGLLLAISASAFALSTCVFATAQIFREYLENDTKDYINVLTTFGMLFSIFMLLLASFVA